MSTTAGNRLLYLISRRCFNAQTVAALQALAPQQPAGLGCCHDALRSWPQLSRYQSSLTHPEATADEDTAQAKVKAMLYRARQRGHLELDLIVGLWAEENVPVLKPPQLAQLQEVLECENPDLFKWLTGQASAPEDLLANDMFKSMQSSVQSKLDAKMPGRAASPEGKEWVRGWDDAWRENSSESSTVPATGPALDKADSK